MQKTLTKKLAIILMLLFGCFSMTAAVTSHHSKRWKSAGFRSSAWEVLSARFSLTHHLNKLSKKRLRWYRKHPDYIKTLTKNARPYLYYVMQEAHKRHIPAEIALLPMIESEYNPFVYSKTGATGLWQLMPGTASGFGIRIDWWFDGRRDVIESTEAALDYLNYLHGRFGNWLLAIAAYDSGEGKVISAIRRNKRLHKPTNFWALSLPRETKVYVPKLLALAEIIRHPTRYHLPIQYVPYKPYFKQIPVDKPINLTRLAKLTRVDVTLVRRLNPGFRRTTSPHGKFHLLFPIHKQRIFIARLNDAQQATFKWVKHKVKKGETLVSLSKRYHTSVARLRKANHLLPGSRIHAMQIIRVPRPKDHKTPTIKDGDDYITITEDGLPGPKRTLYHVRKRDTISRIAHRYHVKSEQVRYWNQLSYHRKLHAGQTLVIWKR